MPILDPIGDTDGLAETFRGYSDEYLLERLQSGELTDAALAIAQRELSNRGIAEPPAPRPWPAPASSDSGPEQWVTVARFLRPIDAHILRGRLEAEGVDAVIADVNTVQTYDLISIAVGGVRVRVPASQVARSLEIIAAVRSGRLAIGDLPPGQDRPE